MKFHSQNEEIEIKSKKFSFSLLMIITGCLFFILWARVAYLQVYEGKNFRRFSDNNRFRKQFLSAPRGLVLDRNQKILIGNKNIIQLKLNLNHIENIEEVLKKVSLIINTPISTIQKHIEKAEKIYGYYHPITIKSSLSLQEIHKLKLLHWDYPGVYLEDAHIRIYPLKDNGSHILGYVGLISKQEREIIQKDNLFIHPLDTVGKRGIEKIYDKHLRGLHGWNFVEVDALNRISQQTISPQLFPKQNPQPGHNIILTLDKDLQQIADQAMNKKDSIGPRMGAVIVMKTNGEILALVSVPGFDSNRLSQGLKQKTWDELSKRHSKLFINKAFQEHYSPGSTFKPFVAIAALSEGIISKNTLLHSPNQLNFGNRIFHDNSRVGHGLINITTALEKSANTFFYQIGDQLGIHTINRYAKLFGFGNSTDLKLKGESPGLLPNPIWKQKHSQQLWHLGDTINVSIGQGFLLTTLMQLTVAYNAIATEGLLVQPFLVQKIGDQHIQHTIKDTLTDRIERKHFQTVKEGLKQVVEGRYGTAQYWKIKNLSYGGKTGTAQVISLTTKNRYKKCKNLIKNHRHHGLFIAIAPIEKPQIIVSVLTEHSCFGSIGSVPIARDIIQYYMTKNKQ